jgi:hypothetical protein
MVIVEIKSDVMWNPPSVSHLAAKSAQASSTVKQEPVWTDITVEPSGVHHDMCATMGNAPRIWADACLMTSVEIKRFAGVEPVCQNRLVERLIAPRGKPVMLCWISVPRAVRRTLQHAVMRRSVIPLHMYAFLSTPAYWTPTVQLTWSVNTRTSPAQEKGTVCVPRGRTASVPGVPVLKIANCALLPSPVAQIVRLTLYVQNTLKIQIQNSVLILVNQKIHMCAMLMRFVLQI